MFDLLLQYHKWKYSVKLWIISKLNNSKAIEEIIYNDIMNTFAYETDGYYKIYMKNAPVCFIDIEQLIQEQRNDYTKINEVDLNYIYTYTLDYITNRLFWFPKVKVIVHNENGLKWFEVHYKNYKQIK